MDVFDFSGQVAIITGAGSPTGIGYGTAQMLGALGAMVILGATTDRVEHRARELRDAGVEAMGVVGDLTQEADALALADAAKRSGGRIDVLVNNAGMISVAAPTFEGGTITQMTGPTWRQGLSRNLDPGYLVSQAAVPVMLDQGYGRIVMVASVTGPIMAMTADIAYATAKAGLVGLTRALAVDLAASGITVNAVAPGWIATASQTHAERREGMYTPIGRSGTPQEVAAAVVALAAPEPPTSPDNAWSSTAATASPNNAHPTEPPERRKPARRAQSPEFNPTIASAVSPSPPRVTVQKQAPPPPFRHNRRLRQAAGPGVTMLGPGDLQWFVDLGHPIADFNSRGDRTFRAS